MAFELPVELVSRDASTSLATAGAAGTCQFCFVALNGTGQAEINGTAGGPVFGVVQNLPQYEGDSANIVAAGVSKVVAGAALTPGTRVMSDANGHAVPYSTAGTVLGTLTTALTAGTAATALAVTALSAPVAVGDEILVTSGNNEQTFVADAPAAAGATSISVDSLAANFAYPVGSNVSDTASAETNQAAGTVLGGTAAANEIASVQLGVL